jgi:anti-sigma regulatory factor (Ser/Thr protein kinase)
MGEPDVRSLDLPPAAASTREARRFIDAALSQWGLESVRDTALLLTSEIVTNAILHARTPVRLTIDRHRGDVVITVTDGSVHSPIRRRQSKDATTGRGIDLLDQLAAEWSVDIGADGKTLRFVVSTTSDPWAAYASTNPARELSQ